MWRRGRRGRELARARLVGGPSSSSSESRQRVRFRVVDAAVEAYVEEPWSSRSSMSSPSESELESVRARLVGGPSSSESGSRRRVRLRVVDAAVARLRAHVGLVRDVVLGNGPTELLDMIFGPLEFEVKLG